MKNEQLIEYCKPRLIEKLSKNTALDKHDLSPQDRFRAPKHNGERPVWSIISIGADIYDQKIHGAGKTPQSALRVAGLEGLIDEAEAFVKEAL